MTQDAYVRGGNQADKFDGIAWGFMGVENHYNNPALDHISILRFDTNGLMGLKATSAKLKLHIRGVDTRPDKTGGNKDTACRPLLQTPATGLKKKASLGILYLPPTVPQHLALPQPAMVKARNGLSWM
ncbi:hypothetical protein P4S64_06780 [Vibrio sp. M60_M31a]